MTLRGLSVAQRQPLMRFHPGLGVGCDVLTTRRCAHIAVWVAEVEDADAGIDRGYGFEPASTRVRLCAVHGERLRQEPRIVYCIKRWAGAA